jgi:hypothetical protein
MSHTRTLEEFLKQTAGVLGEEALGKGYAGSSGAAAIEDSRLADFVADLELPHAEGELLYKLVRWHRKRNLVDLLKIVSWAFIIWRRESHSPRPHAP